MGIRTKAQIFAEAFLFGDTAGDWVMSAEVAGYEEVPAKNQHFIHQELELLKGKKEKLAIIAEDEGVRGNVDWGALAEGIVPKYLKIARGVEKASASQQRALEAIITRGMGRVVEKQRKLEPAGIVILPVLGERENTQICEKCLEKLDA